MSVEQATTSEYYGSQHEGSSSYKQDKADYGSLLKNERYDLHYEIRGIPEIASVQYGYQIEINHRVFDNPN